MVKKNDMFIGIVVVALLLFATGTINFGGAGAIGGAPPGGAGGAAAVGCPTIVAQTLANKSYDFDKRSTVVASADTVYLDAANGVPYPGALATQQLASYDVLMSATNYFSALVHTTTTCSATPAVTGYLRGVDTPTLTVYNTDGTTQNAVANNLSIGSSGSATAHLKFSQTVAYKHLTGESGKFCVFLNATNVTDWAPAQMSAIFNGVPCQSYGAGLGNTAQPVAITGTQIAAWTCSGIDFQANDGSIYDLAIKLQAASGVNPGIASIVNVYYGGADYYADSVTGAVATGCVSDTGAAIQTLRIKEITVS